MTNRPEREDRKAHLAAWKKQQQAAARERFPLPTWQLRDLFDALDEELPLHGCDHSLRLVRAWCLRTSVDAAAVESWVHDNGGHCDCEVLANCEQVFEEAMREK